MQLITNSISIDGFIILSGILKEQVEETSNIYLRDKRLKLVCSETKDEWASILLVRVK